MRTHVPALLASLVIFFSTAAQAQLSGNYTVDASAAASATNYQSLQDVLDDLMNGTRNDGFAANGPGISSAVDVALSAGTYTADTVRAISGTSASAYITFSGDANDSTLVKISDRLVLDNAAYLKFGQLAFANGIELVDSCMDITIARSHIRNGIYSNADVDVSPGWGLDGAGGSSNKIYYRVIIFRAAATAEYTSKARPTLLVTAARMVFPA